MGITLQIHHQKVNYTTSINLDFLFFFFLCVDAFQQSLKIVEVELNCTSPCFRNLHFLVINMTQHTHNSAWHTMHNVICGGAKLADKYLETLRTAKVKINVIHGTRDQIVPIECSINIQKQVQEAEIDMIANADHSSVVLGREKDLTRDLERTWSSVADLHWTKMWN